MNPIFSRTLKALCTIVVAGVLTACGAGSTVDPFKPTRVIGLGDGFNDATATVDDGTTTRTVVGQVAAYFGQSNVESYASAQARISNLSTQIDSVVGGFSSGDLVVIAVGAFDVKVPGVVPATEAQTLVTQVRRLKTAGVKHILIMPVLNVSRTPWGRANALDTNVTDTFNTAVLSALSSAFGGESPNTVIYANASSLTSLFLTATSQATYSPFTDTGFNNTPAGTTPACGDPAVFTGCAASVPTNAGRPYTSMLFANGIHLTPAGNRWVAQYLYNATAQGWR